MKLTLIILGASMLGFLLAEVVGAFAKVRIPFIHNVWWAASLGVLAAGIAL